MNVEISPSLPNFGEGKTQPPHLRSLTLHAVRAVVSPEIAGGRRSGRSMAGGRCHFVGKTIGLLSKSWGGKIVLAGGLTPVAVTLAKMRQRDLFLTVVGICPSLQNSIFGCWLQEPREKLQ